MTPSLSLFVALIHLDRIASHAAIEWGYLDLSSKQCHRWWQHKEVLEHA
jgi:hypothetical protein